MRKSSFKTRGIAFFGVMALALCISLGCFWEDDDTTTPSVTDTTVPTVLSITPTNGSDLLDYGSVVITFSESMNTTVTLGGTLNPNDGYTGQAWTKTTNDNDTLTLSRTNPNGWTCCNGVTPYTLTIEGNDVSNNPLSIVTHNLYRQF